LVNLLNIDCQEPFANQPTLFKYMHTKHSYANTLQTSAPIGQRMNVGLFILHMHVTQLIYMSLN